MTSLEALTILINSSLGDEKAKRKFKKNYGEIVTKLFNDLQVLEILKNLFNYSSNQKFVNNMTADEFFRVKDWLENENN